MVYKSFDCELIHSKGNQSKYILFCNTEEWNNYPYIDLICNSIRDNEIVERNKK
jgi:hypothetical protein